MADTVINERKRIDHCRLNRQCILTLSWNHFTAMINMRNVFLEKDVFFRVYRILSVLKIFKEAQFKKQLKILNKKV